MSMVDSSHLPRPAPGLHVEEVIEESPVSGRVRLIALRAIPQEPEGGERAFDRIRRA